MGIVFRLAGLVAAFIGAAATAHADQQKCDAFRDNMIAMDRKSVRPQGFLELNFLLRDLYQDMCISSPTRDPAKAAPEYWYYANGASTGVRTDAGRPEGASYVATEEIGRFCAGQPMDPSVCAALAGIGHYCSQAPGRSLLMLTCSVFPYDAPDPGTPLPPLQVSLAGKTYTVGNKCARFLAEVQATDPARAPIAVGQDGWQHQLRLRCPPEFVDAAAKLLGRTPDRPDFWPAFGRLALNGFDPARSYTPTSLQNDVDFKRMCDQARSGRDSCWKSWNDMRSIGTQPLGDNGQAGAFKDCYNLYAKVYGMCEAGGREAKRIASLPPIANPEPVVAPAKPADGTAHSAPPPKPQQPQMSAQCQQLVSNYVNAARANDGPRALAGYSALKSAGGCGVLDKVDRAPPPAPAAGGDDRLMRRGERPNTAAVIGTCDRSADGCAQAMRQLEQAASPAAQAAMIMNAIQVGLELGAAMASGLAATVPQGGGYGSGGGGTNYNSIGNRPARRTYGEGSPDVKCPPGGCVGR